MENARTDNVNYGCEARNVQTAGSNMVRKHDNSPEQRTLDDETLKNWNGWEWLIRHVTRSCDLMGLMGSYPHTCYFLAFVLTGTSPTQCLLPICKANNTKAVIVRPELLPCKKKRKKKSKESDNPMVRPYRVSWRCSNMYKWQIYSLKKRIIPHFYHIAIWYWKRRHSRCLSL